MIYIRAKDKAVNQHQNLLISFLLQLNQSHTKWLGAGGWPKNVNNGQACLAYQYSKVIEKGTE